MDEIVNDFLIESNENLDRLDQELVKLESDPLSKELLASIFRTIHTIKGSCGFLGFARLEKLAHAGESLLSRLRDGELRLNEEITSGLLAMVDAVRQMLAAIKTSGQDGEEGYAPLIEHLADLQRQGPKKLEPPQAGATVAPPSQPQASPKSGPAPEASQSSPKPIVIHEVPADASKAVASSLDQGAACTKDPPPAMQKPASAAGKKAGAVLTIQEVASPEGGSPTPRVAEPQNADAVETIRVGVNLLDRLMTLVGELVLARNHLVQFSNSTRDGALQAVSQRMNLIATELQEEVMKTRMQPIGTLWNKFPRTVRDLALNCGKDVRLEMEGQDTELDRTIIEAIKDPLTHLVRNCIDHGIESAEARKRAGKDATGVLKIRAFHEGGQVNIEITDDGAGLNGERIRQKAIERGLVSAQQAAKMSDRDAFNMIFLPGFSTAEKVTKVSGRGVGMDVVKTNVEKIGGTVDVQSTPGKGTTVKVKIPLTLAIIPALVVTSAGERFAIPQVSLLELVRLEAGENGKGIEMVHDAPVYRLRGSLLPLVYLARELGTKPGNDSTGGPSAVNIVVLQAEDRQFGLIVDEITDTQEIVVKPLEKQLKGISAYSGATIMGDGRVALILDVPGLAQRARVVSDTPEAGPDELRAETLTNAAQDGHALLLAENGLEGRVAIPLSMVARLEEFPKSVIERAGAQEVMQYRGQIIPLVRLSQIIPAVSDSEMLANENSIQVVVYSEGKHTVGLVVDRIVDIVEERAAVESLAPRPGVIGSFVTQHHVTDLLDVAAIVRAAAPGLLDTEPEAGRA